MSEGKAKGKKESEKKNQNRFAKKHFHKPNVAHARARKSKEVLDFVG